MVKSRSPCPAGRGDAPSPQPNHALLEKRGRSSPPYLALLFGNVLYVVDVRRGLRQHMMQVVAQAEKRKALFQKFPDARRAKQKKSENDVVLPRVVGQFLRRRAQLRRGVHVRKLILVVEAHRHAEIVLSEEQNVNARNGGDLGDVFDTGCGLDLERDDALVIPVA